MTGTICDLFIHKLSRSYLNHLVLNVVEYPLLHVSAEDSHPRGKIPILKS
jgi:hypothetical protein